MIIDSVEAVVIGAGVIGLATARALSKNNIEVLILEQEESFGTHTSSRNSEVIHAGIYYNKDSLKAKFCLKGNKMLYDYCKLRNIPHNRIGKLIVATNASQKNDLNLIMDTAIKNGVTDLQRLNKNEILNLEPNINAIDAIWSPSSGIIDSHLLMLSFLGEAEDNSCFIAYNSKFVEGSYKEPYISIVIKDKNNLIKLKTKYLINCAGLYAQEVSKSIKNINLHSIPKLFMAKGNYLTLTKKSPFSHLIYPVPESGGLGIHVTIDMSGAVRFGPNVEWVNKLSYELNKNIEKKFYESIRNYWPDLKKNNLVPGYAGIRPKVVPKDSLPGDFIISHASNHGIPGYIAMYGIESPGLTSSLPIARYVSEILLNSSSSS